MSYKTLSVLCQILAKDVSGQFNALSKLTSRWLVRSLELLAPSIQATIKYKQLALSIAMEVSDVLVINLTIKVITVPAVDFEDRNVFCLTRDKPKSQTYEATKVRY